MNQKGQTTTRLYSILTTCLMGVFSCTAQFDKIEVIQIDNEELVPGNTYRIYAIMTSEGDYIDAVFGGPETPLNVTSTEPFYQHEMGGGMSKDTYKWNCNVEMNSKADKALLFDSWVTIGWVDNYENDLRFTDQEALDRFEAGESLTTTNGACWALPRLDAENRIIQAGPTFAGQDKRILLMQLTTTGTVKGLININGKQAPARNEDGQLVRDVVRVSGIEFVCHPSL